MTLYMLKYDGDTVESHPWTLVALEQVEGATFKIADTVQLIKLETATDLLKQLQAGTCTLDELTVY